MEFQWFLPFSTAFLAIASGIVFGFLLRKATVSRFDTIVGQLLLKDFTVMKVILTAIVAGSIGIYFLGMFGYLPGLHLSKTPILFSLIGGSIFGVGMSLTGYCPGTAIAALAEGSKDMLFALPGMLIGSIIFNALSPSWYLYMIKPDQYYQKTLDDLFIFPQGFSIFFVFVMWLAFVFIMHRYENKSAIQTD